jgi:chemotaxis protein MotA
VGLLAAVGVIVLGQLLEGGSVRSLLQPTAASVVFGGTAAALLVSFPLRTLQRTALAIRDAFLQPAPALKPLILDLTNLATRSKRKGLMSLDTAVIDSNDRFLERAIAFATDGLPTEAVRRAMETESRVQEDADDEPAQVLEAAAGYAPTLGILGAVLGLIHVMENLAAPSKLGAGIAIAFVATVYGVGSANLIFLPLAAKVRHAARTAALRREMIVEAVASMQQGVHPRQLEEQLEAYVKVRDVTPVRRKAA